MHQPSAVPALPTPAQDGPPPASGPVHPADIDAVLRDPRQPHLVFQSIVDLQRGVVAGYEALARFTGPPLAPPDQWFHTADAIGLGAELEARVIRQALAVRHTMPPNCFLAINVSPHLLPSAAVQSAFAEVESLAGVVVELTEHVPVHDHAGLVAAIDRLRAAKAQIAIDDAGSGYAGLQQLLAVRPQLVKLDRALVDNIDGDEIKRAVAHMLGNVAGRMDAWLLAEGIERDEELEAAISLGVPLGQGWVFGRPSPQWAGVEPDMATRIRLLSYREYRRDTILSLIQPAGNGRVLAAVGTPGASSWSVRVDGDDCPLSLHRPDLGVECIPVSLRVHPTDTVEDVALRALARDPQHRFDPLVAVDDSGRFVGLVVMERLIARLAERSGVDDAHRSPTAGGSASTAEERE